MPAPGCLFRTNSDRLDILARTRRCSLMPPRARCSLLPIQTPFPLPFQPANCYPQPTLEPLYFLSHHHACHRRIRSSYRTLSLQFRSGAFYLYFAVPQAIYHEFLAAPSKGAYFNRHIRPSITVLQTSTSRLICYPALSAASYHPSCQLDLHRLSERRLSVPSKTPSQIVRTPRAGAFAFSILALCRFCATNRLISGSYRHGRSIGSGFAFTK